MILCDDGRTRNLRGKWSGGRHRGAVEAKGDERVSETVPGVLVVLFDFFPQDLRALSVFGCEFSTCSIARSRPSLHLLGNLGELRELTARPRFPFPG